MSSLKPPFPYTYPPFKNGLYMEEYFSKFWENESFPLKENFIYLDIFWQNLFHHYGGGGSCGLVMKELTGHIQNICENAKKENKIVFAVCQWDDGIQLQCEKPDNLVIFSIGGSNNIKDKAINLPLIAQDVFYRLRDIKKIPLQEKTILCSFIGTCTHWVRNKIVETLGTHNDFKFIVKDGWSVDIPQDKVDTFVQTTLQSKFGLAPRGYGNSSFRFFEIMELDVVPVYVHDDDNGLPYLDFLDYSKFAVVIHIKYIAELPDILNKITDDEYNAMLNEMKRVRLWFTQYGVCHYVREYLVHNVSSFNRSI